MIKLFRKSRQNLIMENIDSDKISAGSKTSKYFKYAIGEILLVVIGILIALNINNWNQKRVASNIMQNYYQKMHQELTLLIPSVKRVQIENDTIRQKNKRSLEILNLKDKDSLFKLSETLGALGTAYPNEFTFPIMQEFLSQNQLSKVKNDSLKLYIQAFSLFMNRSKGFDDYLNNQYHTVIEPYFNTHINYSEVAEDHHKTNLVNGEPKTDYLAFENNLELWNILTFKLETSNSHTSFLKSFATVLEKRNKQLIKEL